VKSSGSASAQRSRPVVAAPVFASLTRIAEAEMQAAPSTAASTGERPRSGPGRSLPVMTVLSYGPDMALTLEDRADRSQSGFGPDLVEALTACAELINTGRPPGGELLGTVADVQAFADHYAFHGKPARDGDVTRLRGYRARLDEIVTRCEAGDDGAAAGMINALLMRTGAVPQIVAHDGRGPHLHVSRPTAPLADRIAAHLAMGLAELVVAGQSERMRTCASPTCRNVFLDLSRNRSRRYCDNSCGNRLHVAAYRTRKAAAG
jgi:predicted RNA-binding Zn ribbon-like protein